MEVDGENAEIRPNIRIEIQNNLMEAMEVEQEKPSDGEDGEITDVNDFDPLNQHITYLQRPETINKERTAVFTTGIDIFDEAEQEKLSERAKRFQLNPQDIHNFTESHLKELHESLGVSAETEKNVRFEALHMMGTNSMSTEEVLEYFFKYAPVGIEWITDDSCNIVWNDRVTAARAMFYLSKPIKGMPVGGSCDPFLKDLEEEEDKQGGSILLKNKHREVEMREEVDKENGEVHVSDITIPIPPGFWRLGEACKKSKYILLRFALKSDKKPVRAEKFSEYYKKFGNPNYGGLKGIISESRKQQFRGIFDRNHEIEDSKNPWGSLARNWDQDFVHNEAEYRSVETPLQSKASKIQQRLGFKRALQKDEKEEEEEEAATEPPKKVIPEKKAKIPRMRMYADEEEERIKRRLQLRALKREELKTGSKNSDDLRNVLRLPNRKKHAEEIVIEVDSLDLGAKLKNRKIKEAVATTKAHMHEMRMRADDYVKMMKHTNMLRRRSPERRKERYADYDSKSYIDDDGKTGSKVTVVIKKHKAPAVASTVWSRIPSERDRLKTVSEGKLRVRRESSSSMSTSASSKSESESDEEEEIKEEGAQPTKNIQRPGFSAGNKSNLKFMGGEKARIEIKIKNDHFRAVEIPLHSKASEIQQRLGFKHALWDEEKEEEEAATEPAWKLILKKKAKIPRMHMYADEEEERIKLRALELEEVKTSKNKYDLRNKATVAIIKYKAPAAASTVWSRLGKKLHVRWESSSSMSTSASSKSESESDEEERNSISETHSAAWV